MAVASASLLASCAAQPTTQQHLPAKNEARWVLPLDQYQRPRIDTVLDATQLLVQACLKTKGYDWQVFVESSEAKDGPSWNAVQRKLFSARLAEEYGYGNSDELALPLAKAKLARSIDSHNRQIGTTASTQVDDCFSKAVGELGDSDDAYSLVEQLAGVAYDDAKVAPAVRTADEKWRKCMSKVGVPDLPSSPDQMPPDSISDLTPSVDAPAPLIDEPVPAEEKRVAVADARCRVTSDYAKASYDAEWAAQVKALSANADALNRYAAKTKAARAKAAQVIATHAPSN